MLSFFLLSILALTFYLACLVLAPLANARSRAVRAAFTALLCFDMEPGKVSEIDLKEETTFFRHFFGSQVGQGLYFLHDFCSIHSMEIPMLPVVERNILVDPLGMCDL